ncbi:bifunctional UDP-sugar hydrolase/5'-nucleotidase [Haloquadratum walsbyi]|nr:5'-nucleotidase C-terminal domain-containing protein [Haloquadratum walsbyi]
MPRLLQYSDVENVFDNPRQAGHLAGAIRTRSDSDTIVCGTGDNTAPGVLALIDRGQQALELFEAVSTDVETFGNHDFDFGTAATRSIVAASPQTWVSTNVYHRDSNGTSGDRFAADDVVPTIIESVDGETVGFMGITDPATPSLNPMADDLYFTNPYDAAENAVETLRAADVDYVVALSHLGSGDGELAQQVDIDVILGGHLHRKRHEWIDGTLCLRPGANGKAIIEVTLDTGEITATRHETANAPLADDVVSALQGRIETAGLDEVVAHVSEPLERTDSAVFGGESRIGNFVADAYRWALDTDIGLQNSGGIRNGPALCGDITVADLIGVIPFNEHIVRAELTGETLRAVLRESAASVVDFGEPEWWHSHLSGVTVVWDDDAETLQTAYVDNELIDPEQSYTLATSAYVLHSDHEFPTLSNRHRVGEGDIQFEVLIEYVRERGIDAAMEGRVQRIGTINDESVS